MKEHIICVDDEEGILTALRQQLGVRFGDECEISLAQSAQDALELVDVLIRENVPVALVIADQIMPGMKGVELLEEINRRLPQTTKVLLTGQAGLDAVVAAINRAGLNRYIPKPWDEPDLRLTVEALLQIYRLHREKAELIESLHNKNLELQSLNQELDRKVHDRTLALEEANSRLAQLAITDGLTGIYNHRFFQDRLGLEVARSLRSQQPLSLMMIDVDHFKMYNDRHGHPAGDEILRTVARLISEERRQNDIVARYGGEEFGVLLVDTEKTAAAVLADRVRQRIVSHPFPLHETQPGGCLSVSIGIASCPQDAGTAPELLSAADQALYRAKRAGRNRVAS